MPEPAKDNHEIRNPVASFLFYWRLILECGVLIEAWQAGERQSYVKHSANSGN